MLQDGVFSEGQRVVHLGAEGWFLMGGGQGSEGRKHVFFREKREIPLKAGLVLREVWKAGIWGAQRYTMQTSRKGQGRVFENT